MLYCDNGYIFCSRATAAAPPRNEKESAFMTTFFLRRRHRLHPLSALFLFFRNPSTCSPFLCRTRGKAQDVRQRQQSRLQLYCATIAC